MLTSNLEVCDKCNKEVYDLEEHSKYCKQVLMNKKKIRGSNKMEYPEDIDKECIPLCDAINKIKGLKTTESCCGHGKDEFRIWFSVNKDNELELLLYYIDSCHVGFNWEVKLHTDCSMCKPKYGLYSLTKGKKAYKEANKIAKAIEDDLKEKK